jgi:hypothetical protein
MKETINITIKLDSKLGFLELIDVPALSLPARSRGRMSSFAR